MSSQPPSASAAQGSAAAATWAAVSMTARSSSVTVKSMLAARPPLQPQRPPGDDSPQHLVGAAPDREARGDQPGRQQVTAQGFGGAARAAGPPGGHLDHPLLDVGGEDLGHG